MSEKIKVHSSYYSDTKLISNRIKAIKKPRWDKFGEYNQSEIILLHITPACKNVRYKTNCREWES